MSKSVPRVGLTEPSSAMCSTAVHVDDVSQSVSGKGLEAAFEVASRALVAFCPAARALGFKISRKSVLLCSHAGLAERLQRFVAAAGFFIRVALVDEDLGHPAIAGSDARLPACGTAT